MEKGLDFFFVGYDNIEFKGERGLKGKDLFIAHSDMCSYWSNFSL